MRGQHLVQGYWGAKFKRQHPIMQKLRYFIPMAVTTEHKKIRLLNFSLAGAFPALGSRWHMMAPVRLRQMPGYGDQVWARGLSLTLCLVLRKWFQCLYGSGTCRSRADREPKFLTPTCCRLSWLNRGALSAIDWDCTAPRSNIRSLLPTAIRLYNPTASRDSQLSEWTRTT